MPLPGTEAVFPDCLCAFPMEMDRIFQERSSCLRHVILHSMSRLALRLPDPARNAPRPWNCMEGYLRRHWDRVHPVLNVI